MIDVQVLEKAVIKCGKLLWQIRLQGRLVAENKDELLGAHFSTRGDRESQDLGIAILRESDPDEIIIAEEQENAKSVPADCTVVDPCDGTTNYFNGSKQFGVTMCVLRDGQPYAGATYYPTDYRLISAVKSRGCYRGGFGRGKKITQIPWHGQLDKLQIATDVGPWSHIHGSFDLVLRPLSERFTVLSLMAAIYGARGVLFGEIAAYYNLGIAKIWDATAGALFIQEAGGVVCAPDGSPLQWDTLPMDWVMASNPEAAEIVLEHTRSWPGRKK